MGLREEPGGARTLGEFVGLRRRLGGTASRLAGVESGTGSADAPGGANGRAGSPRWRRWFCWLG